LFFFVIVFVCDPSRRPSYPSVFFLRVWRLVGVEFFRLRRRGLCFSFRYAGRVSVAVHASASPPRKLIAPPHAFAIAAVARFGVGRVGGNGLFFFFCQPAGAFSGGEGGQAWRCWFWYWGAFFFFFFFF